MNQVGITGLLCSTFSYPPATLPWLNPLKLKALVSGSLKKKLPELELAIAGIIAPKQAMKTKIIKQHYEDLQLRRAELESIILSLARILP
ncbi:hypothetical protein [Paenibacillus humicus]|uniref:hypothetical protein n=1 Tax=Paenibacillus humicus TaxID=412861 RepID=UPI003F16669E